MNRTLPLSLIAAVVLSALAPLHRATASDETHDTEVKVRAALDATNCEATPPTITVLGLVIDVSTAAIDAASQNTDAGVPASPGAENTTSHHQNGGTQRGNNDVGPTGCYYCATAPTPVPTVAPAAAPVSGCAALVAGQSVEVELAADTAPLIATSVKQRGDGAEDVVIKAPIQDIDSTVETITVLGLPVDISGAGLDGSDDGDNSSGAIDASTLMIGQFAEIQLASSSAPLVATELEVKNANNEIEVEVEDAQGNEIEDTDDNGNPADDISVDVDDSVLTQAAPAGTGTAHVRKHLHFHAEHNGTFTLSGLPTGIGTIVVTRNHGGVTTTNVRRTKVRGNNSRHLHVRLRSPRP